MSNKLKPSKLFAIVSIVSVLGAVAAISGFVNAQNSPQNAQVADNSSGPGMYYIGDITPPLDLSEFTVLPPGQKITGRLGLPAAQLIAPPAELTTEIAVWVLPPKEAKTLPPDAIGVEINSSVRYRGNGHTIFVTTARLSPAAAKMRHYFGKPDKLSDGTSAGIAVACGSINTQTNEGFSCMEASPSGTPNQVTFMRGNQIIQVSSDLPINQVKELAKNASLK